MERDQFEYNENTLLEILDRSAKSAFRYQTSNNPTFGEHIVPEEQKRLDEGRENVNILFYLDFAEDMGLMKAIAHSTERNPLSYDINGKPISVSTYRMTYRGIRYLQSPRWRRWLFRNFPEINPSIAILGLIVAWLSLLISIWVQ